MNYLLTQRRFILAGLFLSSLVMLLARPITIICLSVLDQGAGFATSTSPASAILAPVKKGVTPVAPVKHAKAKRIFKESLPVVMPTKDVAVPAELNGASLRSYSHDYQLTFSGNVTCGGQPCIADVELIVNTDRNLDLHKLVKTSDTGAFELNISLSELTQSQLDWHIVARRRDFRDGDVRGRQILMDDQIAINRDLDLH